MSDPPRAGLLRAQASDRYDSHMLQAISLLVYALAVARLTRLVVTDRITDAPRRWLSIRLWAPYVREDVARKLFPGVVEAYGVREARRLVAMERLDDGAEPPLPVYLLTCPWCVSVYVGFPAALLVYLAGSSPWLFVPALALAFSQFTGLLAQNGK